MARPHAAVQPRLHVVLVLRPGQCAMSKVKTSPSPGWNQPLGRCCWRCHHYDCYYSGVRGSLAVIMTICTCYDSVDIMFYTSVDIHSHMRLLLWSGDRAALPSGQEPYARQSRLHHGGLPKTDPAILHDFPRHDFPCSLSRSVLLLLVAVKKQKKIRYFIL